MKLLLDGDILCYRFAYSNTNIFKWDEDIESVVETPDLAIVELDNFIEGVKEVTKTDIVFVCLSSDMNFRYSVLPTYKHNRADKTPPELAAVIKRYLFENYQVKIKPRLEADDVMGILSTKNPDSFVVASIDKDLKQIPGWYYNWNTEEFRKIPLEEANHNFYMQILMGDPTDGYSGCPGIGPKKAEKILEGAEEAWEPWVWQQIVQAYEKKGLTEWDALVQARVARILRAEDWDFADQEVKLWTPSLT